MGNALCELLGIRYPIIQGAMEGVCESTLAAAVSNAGALGMLSSVSAGSRLREEIHRVRQLTDRPFGVNMPFALLGGQRVLEITDLLIEEKVPVVVTAAGDPMKMKGRFDGNGSVWVHVTASVNHARKAESAGARAVVASGIEAGGILSRDQVTTLALVPQVVDAVTVPVVAAGGIGDGRALLAAMVLGAQGVQMGTRFIASVECQVKPAYKEAVVTAIDTSTAAVDGTRGLERFIKTDPASPEPARRYGAGQVSGLIREIRSVEEIVTQTIEEARALAQTLGMRFADL